MLLTLSAILALSSFPIFCVLYFVVSMFSDSTGSGAWLLPFESNIKFLVCGWIGVLILFILATYLKSSVGKLGSVLAQVSIFVSLLFLTSLVLITFSYKNLGGYFGMDFFHTYYKYKIIDNVIDRSTFVVLSSPAYAMDSKHAYYASDKPRNPLEIMLGVDLDTFTPLNFHFAKDKDHLYYEGVEVIISGLNMESFVPLNYSYAKDRYHVYYLSYGMGEKVHVIPGADVETFEIVEDVPGRSVAKDKGNTYKNTGYDFSMNGEKLKN